MQNVFKRLPANMDQGSGQSWYEEDTFSAELHHDVPNILPFAIRRDENTTLRIYYHILFVPSSFLVGGFSIYLPWPLELAVTTTILCVPSLHCTQTRCCRPRSVALNVECVQNMKFYLRSAAAASLPRSLFSSSQYLQLGIYLHFPSSGSHQTPVRLCHI